MDVTRNKIIFGTLGTGFAVVSSSYPNNDKATLGKGDKFKLETNTQFL